MFLALPGQACVLQSSSLVDLPSHLPPWASFTIFHRVYFCFPPPHSLEHFPSFCQLTHLQSTGGQAFVLQSSIFVSLPSHLPPPDSGTFLVRLYVIFPPPHVWEQDEGPPQLFHWQSTGTELTEYEIYLKKALFSLNNLTS